MRGLDQAAKDIKRVMGWSGGKLRKEIPENKMQQPVGDLNQAGSNYTKGKKVK